MQILHIFDTQNYDNTWNCFKREAVRAIILKDNKIALVKSEKEGFYKFPGGGIEGLETHTETIVRETLEETGLHIIPQSIKEFGTIIEKRKSIYGDNEIFMQYSHYYFAEIGEESSQHSLDAYEEELGYHLELADLKEAWTTNINLAKNYNSEFLYREAYIMELLMNNFK
jgi:8-oxo-dGTP diphosphatase